MASVYPRHCIFRALSPVAVLKATQYFSRGTMGTEGVGGNFSFLFSAMAIKLC